MTCSLPYDRFFEILLVFVYLPQIYFYIYTFQILFLHLFLHQIIIYIYFDIFLALFLCCVYNIFFAFSFPPSSWERLVLAISLCFLIISIHFLYVDNKKIVICFYNDSLFSFNSFKFFILFMASYLFIYLPKMNSIIVSFNRNNCNIFKTQ